MRRTWKYWTGICHSLKQTQARCHPITGQCMAGPSLAVPAHLPQGARSLIKVHSEVIC